MIELLLPLILKSAQPQFSDCAKEYDTPASSEFRVVETAYLRFEIPENYRTVAYSPTNIRVLSPGDFCMSQQPTDNFSFISITHSESDHEDLPRGTSGVTEYQVSEDQTTYTSEVNGYSEQFVATDSAAGGSMIASVFWASDETESVFNSIRFRWIVEARGE